MSKIVQDLSVHYSENDIKQLIIEDLRARGHVIQPIDVRREGGWDRVGSGEDPSVRIVHVTGYEVRKTNEYPRIAGSLPRHRGE